MHLGFGAGIHRCVGAAVARAQAMVAFRLLVEREDRFQLHLDRAVRRPHPVFRSFDLLPTTPVRR